MKLLAKRNVKWTLVLSFVASLFVAVTHFAVSAEPPQPTKTKASVADKEADAPAVVKPVDPKAIPTHEQTSIITIPAGDQKLAIHTFCVDTDGRLLATCGGKRMMYIRSASGSEIKEIEDPAGIKVLSPSGKLLDDWSLDITPQAINVGEDGTIYAGGQGRLVKLDKKGKVLLTADAPNVSELPPLPEIPKAKSADETEEAAAAKKEKDAKVKLLREQQQAMSKELNEVHGRMRKLEKDSDAKAKAAAAAEFESVMGRYQQLRQQIEQLTVDARTLAIRARSTALRKRAITGMGVTKSDVFIACPASKGYGYDVWRTDLDFGQPKKVVTSLRGCCGQMDIQAHGGKLYVAENSRKRVVCYDRDGKELAAWGSSSRTDVVGFGSCCNPMNLRFGPDDMVYTSESNVGRIKRFTPDGEFLGVVGTVTIVPGCKHVAIGTSPDGKTIYMLDITRNHIVVMTESTGNPKTAARAPLGSTAVAN